MLIALGCTIVTGCEVSVQPVYVTPNESVYPANKI